MNSLSLRALICASIFLLAGCAFMSDEDKDFYGKGWVKPTDLDQPPVHHSIPDPTAPTTAAAPDPNAATTRLPTDNTASDPQWIVPQTH
jgi:hypothetical protein